MSVSLLARRLVPRVITSLLVAYTAACYPDGITGPSEPPPKAAGPVALISLKCHASVLARTVSCAQDSELSGFSNLRNVKDPGFGSMTEFAPVGPVAAPKEAILIGHQHVNISILTRDVAFAADSFTFNTAVANRSPQPIGTVDGVTADSSLAIFFSSGPTATSGSGVITVANPTGTYSFTGSDQPFYRYAEILSQNDTSAYLLWKLNIASGVSTFSFYLLVHASVQHPDGFVEVFPGLDSMAVAGTVDLADSVRNALGWPMTGETVTWSSSADSVATVNSTTGLVTGVSPGTATITATNGPRTGTGTIVVVPAPPAPAKLGVTTRPSDSVQSGVVFGVQPAVQLLDDADNPVAQPGVEITAAIVSGGGTLGGTVTATTDAAGLATFTDLRITGTVGSRTLSFKAAGLDSVVSDLVHVTAGAPASISVIEAANAATAGGAVTVTGTVLDASSNPVSGIAVDWTSTNGGSFTPSASGTTNESGVASVTFSVAVTPGTQHTVIGTIAGPIADTTGTIVVTGPPTAVADSSTSTSAPGDAFHTAFNTQFTLSASGLLSNDNLGSPEATVTSFGADSLGGTVTSNSAGTTVSPLPGYASGSLTVGANGTVAFTPPTGFTGYYVFQYRLSNGAGSSDATVRIAVGARPSAASSTYTPHLLGNVGINTSASSMTKVNATGDGITYNKTGEANGIAVIHADGTFEFNPAVAHTGAASFSFTVTNGFGTSSAATVSLTVDAPRIWFVESGAPAGGDGRKGSPFNCLVGASGCFNGSANAIGDIVYVTSGSYGNTAGLALKNSQRIIGQGASGNFADASNANVTWPADAGAPPATGGARPTINSGGANVFVLGSGNTLKGLVSGSATGVSITGSAIGTLTMANSAIINGSGRALDLSTSGTLAVTLDSVVATGGTGNGINLHAQSGAFASGVTRITNPSGTGINVINSAGFSFGTTVVRKTTTAGTGVNLNTNTGTTTFASLVDSTSNGDALVTSGAGTVNASAGMLHAVGGAALSATNTVLGVTFTATNSSGSSSDGVFLTQISGSVSLGSGSISGKTNGIRILGASSGTVSYSGTVGSSTRPVNISNAVAGACPNVTLSGSISSTANGILVNNCNSGTITFSGPSISLKTTTNPGVLLTSNAGAAINFTGGALVDSTTTGNAFDVSGGGTVAVTGANNILRSAGGTALNFQNTTIGASGLTFRSISAAGGPNGIVLVNTGISNGLLVTGDGATVGSGGTITGSTGADGAIAGAGVYLDNTRNVQLKFLILSNTSNFGLKGNAVVGLTVDNSRFAGTHGTNENFDEAAISVAELTGVALFTNDSISGGKEDNIRILNTMGTLDSLVISNSRVGHMDNTTGNDAVLIRVQDAAVVRAKVRNSTFHGARGDMLQLNVVNSGDADLQMTGNTFNNTHANVVSGVGGITLSGGGAGSAPKLRYNIAGNSFRGARGSMLVISKTSGTADYAGTVENNVFGQSGIGAGTNNTTSTEGSAINYVHHGGGVHTARAHNNQIYGYNNYGFLMELGDFSGGGGHGTLNATITNNTIAEPGSFAFPQQGIHVNAGLITDDAGIACVNLTGNLLNDSGDTQDIRLRQRMKTTVILPGYGGSASDNTAVNNFVKANNGNAASLVVAASNSVGLGPPDGPGNGFLNGSCPTP